MTQPPSFTLEYSLLPPTRPVVQTTRPEHAVSFPPLIQSQRLPDIVIPGDRRSLGPMTDGMAAAQENLNVFYSAGSVRGHQVSTRRAPEEYSPSHQQHGEEEADTPFRSKASSWGGIPSTAAAPIIEFSTRVGNRAAVEEFAPPLRDDAASSHQAPAGPAGTALLNRAEGGSGQDACRKAEEVMRLSRAWRLALLGGGTPPAPSMQGRAAAAAAAPALSTPALMSDAGISGGVSKSRIQQTGIEPCLLIPSSSSSPSESCLLHEGVGAKGPIHSASGRRGGESASGYPNEESGRSDALVRQHGTGKTVDHISLARQSLGEERHPEPLPMVPPSPPGAMPTEPCIREWLRAHDLQCIESRLVAAGGGGVEGASLLTESDCDSISMGLANIR